MKNKVDKVSDDCLATTESAQSSPPPTPSLGSQKSEKENAQFSNRNSSEKSEKFTSQPKSLDLAEFLYLNHRGETSLRRVRPIRIWFGSTAWHPIQQWMLEVFDLEKMATRDYAMAGILGSWKVADSGNATISLGSQEKKG